MSIASSLAQLALSATKSGKNAVSIIETAGTVVAAASILLEQVKPLMEDADTRAMAERFRASANGVARNAGSTVANATEEAVSRAGALFTKLGDAKDGVVESLAQAKNEKGLRKAIREARQSVLDNATTSVTAADLLKAKEKDTAGIGPINNLPGCFVIATYRKLDFDKDLTDYIGIYIGAADNAAQGVDIAISRDGDPDVYADVKYKQNVRIFVYNCMPEELEKLHESLTQTFTDTLPVVA